MSCGEYRVHDKHGEPKAAVVMSDRFAQGFPRLKRLADAPCPGEPEQTPLLARAGAWLKAEVGLLVKGRVADDVYDRRVTACRQCPHLVRHEADEVGFCGACGCGTRSRARIAAVKAHMPDATCPAKRW
jgi:hypothetical protein